MSGKKYKPLKLRKEIKAAVRKAVEAQPIIDMHTHLYPPSFGTTLGGPKRTSDPAGLLLWGVEGSVRRTSLNVTIVMLRRGLSRPTRPVGPSPDEGSREVVRSRREPPGLA